MAKKGANSVSVFLVGPMGSGKTTIGRHLAKSLRYEFIDSDHEIEARTGANIPLIFEIEGEAGFRHREQAVIDELSRRKCVVLATGGGAVLNEESRARLRQRGIVVYLTASPEALFLRTGRDKNRPLLQTEDPLARLSELLQQRDPLYRDAADIVLDTGGDAVRTVVRTLVELIGRVSRHKKLVPATDGQQQDKLKPL